MSEPSTRARCCPSCGALNGSDFDRCIRCGAALSGLTTAAAGLGRYLDGSSLIVTKAIAALTTIVFAAQVMATLKRGLPFPFTDPGAGADLVHFGVVAPALAMLEPYRLLAAVFVHLGLIHFGMNMFALSNLSRTVEPMVGSARYAIAYVTAGIASFATSVAVTILSGSRGGVTAGASGAIFGLMGLILGILWRRKDPRWKGFAVQAVLFSVMFGFAVNASNAGILVNNSAHLGGLGCGILFGLVYAHNRPPKRDLPANVGAAIALVLCVLSLYLAHASPLWRQFDSEASRSIAPEAPLTALTPARPVG
jgi:membrane associated rhomboid family serine protease